MRKKRIVVSKNGPYRVSGGVPLRKEISMVGGNGEPERWARGRQYPVRKIYNLCRCGKSKDRPFCDGTHASFDFDGTEQASRRPFAEQAETIEGPRLDLKDVESLCASARFCLAKGGTWKLTLESDDAGKRRTAIRQAGNCPSGRLVAYGKKSGEPIEPRHAPSISLIEDPQAGVSGPIWVKGEVEIESQRGRVYERRNRVTLCRCGCSDNKPFCDGSHVRTGFNDGDESLE